MKDLANLTTGPDSPFLREYKFSDVSSMSDKSDLITFNRLNMSIVLPDTTVYTGNYNVTDVMTGGCQGICMNFQTFDNEMKFAYEIFNGANSAFVLKPESLRSIKTKIGPFTGVSEESSCAPKREHSKLVPRQYHSIFKIIRTLMNY